MRSRPGKLSGMSNRRLPQELIDAIVEELDDDGPCLPTCVKTAKMFRAPCQRRIFRTMILYDEDSGYSNTCQRASDLLNSCPRLVEYVHDLTIPLPMELEGARALESVLRILPSVRRFDISSRNSVNWNSIPANLASAIIDIISLPTLDRLRLNAMIYVPFSLIHCAVTSARSLSLGDIFVDGGDASVSLEPPQVSPSLEHLILCSHNTVFYLRGFMREYTKAGYFRHLRRLSIKLESWFHADQLDVLTDIFAPLSSTLLHLDINYACEYVRSFHIISTTYINSQHIVAPV